MAFVGKLKIHPNHPFAHDQISFVPNQESSSSNSSESTDQQDDPMRGAVNMIEQALRRKDAQVMAEVEKERSRLRESTTPKPSEES